MRSTHTQRSKIIAAIVLAGGLAAALAVVMLTVLGPPPDMGAQVAAARALLAHARTTGTVQAYPEVAQLPLPTVKDPTRRKTLFIAAMLRLVAGENTRIDDQRARAKEAPEGSPAYAALAHAYGLHPEVERTVLLRRIDRIPVSLVLAQGAIESAWGTSRFAREGNAYFGERTYDEAALGLTPTGQEDPANTFKVKSFPHARLSVRSFLYTLNTHPTYRALRHQRAALRLAGKRPGGLDLAPYLHGYSEIGDAYVQRVTAIIQAGDLGAYDGLQLAP